MTTAGLHWVRKPKRVWRRRAPVDLAMLVLLGAATGLVVCSAPQPLRALTVLAAMVAVPGWVVVSRSGLAEVTEPVTMMAVSTAVSLAVETVAGLAILWLHWFQPLDTAASAGALLAVLLVEDATKSIRSAR